jgi:hypothetical protein
MISILCIVYVIDYSMYFYLYIVVICIQMTMVIIKVLSSIFASRRACNNIVGHTPYHTIHTKQRERVCVRMDVNCCQLSTILCIYGTAGTVGEFHSAVS